MNHTIKQILANQDKFKKEIVVWLKQDFREQKKELAEIKVDNDKEIAKSLKALKKKFKNLGVNALIESLLFRSGSKKRSKTYYAWWDEELEEVIICTYGEKAISRSTGRPGVRR
ncbi:MAG: hypothetical protein P8J32_00150 [bacterium]|nr:hypothetical protein [bacterium]